MNIKLIVLTGVCLLTGFCQGAETPSETTGTTNLPTKTTPSSTSSTTTPPQSKTWVVVDKTTNEKCIAAHIISQFDFAYPVEIKANAKINTGNTIVIEPLDNSAEATGPCTNTSQSIALKWKENSVEIDFKLGEDKNFFLSLNTVNKIDQQNCSETVSTYKSDATRFETKVNVSYKCDQVQHVTVTAVSEDSSAILSISYTKFQASGKNKDNGPVLVLRPTPPEGSNIIRIKVGDNNNTQFWANQLDKYLEEYKKPRSQNVETCRYDLAPQPGKVCDVEVQDLPYCNTQNSYNYPHGTPCIFLKLNQIYGWKPVLYNGTSKLPDKMPQDVKNFIEEANGYTPEWTNTVWVTCEGENPADVENIGTVNYLPLRGFPEFYFPYLNQEGYLSPTVAVQFERPAKNVLINIVCKAWAQNLDNDGLANTGSVHFGLMVEKA